MSTPPVVAPRVVESDNSEVLTETCCGCGEKFQRHAPQQTRCGKCLASLLSGVGDLTTGAALAALQQAASSEDMKRAVTLDDAIKTLNELLELDGRAISQIVRSRARVNAGIVNHPYAKTKPELDGEYYMGVVGLLNALFGAYLGCGAICLRENDGGVGQILGFVRADQVVDNPDVDQ